MNMAETDLQMVQRHVAEGERHIVQQEELISRLEIDELPTQAAKELLSTFRMTLASHRDHLNRIVDELGN
jgi:hypothetical protein